MDIANRSDAAVIYRDTAALGLAATAIKDSYIVD
jgi:hypothetical protein